MKILITIYKDKKEIATLEANNYAEINDKLYKFWDTHGIDNPEAEGYTEKVKRQVKTKNAQTRG